jgi:hypothetical protein
LSLSWLGSSTEQRNEGRLEGILSDSLSLPLYFFISLSRLYLQEKRRKKEKKKKKKRYLVFN